MDENTPTPSTETFVTRNARKARKARKAATGPRVIDAGIAELRRLHADNVQAYQAKNASAKILATIINKRIVQLTEADRQKLLDALTPNTTPAL
jgi:hypothetical protein